MILTNCTGVKIKLHVPSVQQTGAALNAVIVEIRKSTASDPLWFVSAGPMPMEGEALERNKESLQPGEQDNRQFVHLIPHGACNEEISALTIKKIMLIWA